MKMECRHCWVETNSQEGMLAGGILSNPDYGADFVIRSATTTKDKVESKLAKNVDKDREQ